MKYVKLKPSETVVDHRYQRELDTRRVDAMTRSFNPSLLGVPVISKRADDSLVRVDGQHRLAAAVAAGAGDTPVLMDVREGLTLKEEAELFLILNGGRTAVYALAKYKARLVAQEPVALDIQATLKRCGCKITQSQQRGGLMAVVAVERAYHRGVLEGTIGVLVAWLDGAPEAFHERLVDAVSAFLVAFPDADRGHMSSRLESFSPDKLISKLKRETQQSFASKADAARFVFLDIYNQRLPKTKRLSLHQIPAAA